MTSPPAKPKFEVHPDDQALMALIPEGGFLRGSPDDDLIADEDENPQRPVRLSTFYIDVYPVSNRQFAGFIAAGGYRSEHWWSAEGWKWRCEQKIEAPMSLLIAAGQEFEDLKPLLSDVTPLSRPRHPVCGLSWYEADAYARWAHKRLPTEAEWEKAARGDDARAFPWGNEPPGPSHANYANRSRGTSEPGRFPRGTSPYGLSDMAGNVNNWVQDWYHPRAYQTAPADDPLVDDDLLAALPAINRRVRVHRGGGFLTALQRFDVLRCAHRLFDEPETRNIWLGFRTACRGFVV